MDTPQNVNKAVVLTFNKEFLAKGDISVLEDLVADDFINHTAVGTVPKDVSGLVQFITLLHSGFSAFDVVIHEQIADGDVVASRKTIHAKHTGAIMGHEPTGRSIEIKVMDFVRLRDGKYVEHWGQNNIAEVIQSL